MNSYKSMIRKCSIQRKRWVLIALGTLVFNLMATYSANAQDSPCGDDIQTIHVTYFKQVTNSLDARTDPGSTQVELNGSLHYRKDFGSLLKNRPVLIYLHGHEQVRKEPCEIVKYFVGEKNWVVFAGLRRGYSLDQDGDGVPELRSTGIHVDDYVSKCERSEAQAQGSDFPFLYCGSGFCRLGMSCNTAFHDSAVELAYLNDQRIDVKEQISYIKSRAAIAFDRLTKWKLADPTRIVILGHSYGGALAVFTNTEDYGQSVTINISGAELSWTNDDEPYWSEDLQAAMLKQKRPIYLFQPKNAKSLLPTKELFGIAADQLYRSQAAIFPPSACYARVGGEETFPDPLCPDESQDFTSKQVHSTFVSHAEQVARWAPSVVDFANRYPRQ
jgi:hypothetical protein